MGKEIEAESGHINIDDTKRKRKRQGKSWIRMNRGEDITKKERET